MWKKQLCYSWRKNNLIYTFDFQYTSSVRLCYISELCILTPSLCSEFQWKISVHSYNSISYTLFNNYIRVIKYIHNYIILHKYIHVHVNMTWQQVSHLCRVLSPVPKWSFSILQPSLAVEPKVYSLVFWGGEGVCVFVCEWRGRLYISNLLMIILSTPLLPSLLWRNGKGDAYNIINYQLCIL